MNNVEDKKYEFLSKKEVKGFDSLIRKSDKIQSMCHDFNVEPIKLGIFRFNNDGLLQFMPKGEIRHEEYPLSRYALSQLGSKFGVPADYLHKCISTGRLDLAADNINSWVDDYGKPLFIREYDGHIRGILSDKYSVCDTPDILRVLDDVLDMKKYVIKNAFLNEERLHLRFVSKERLTSDDDLFPALFVDSSDIGRNVLTVQFGIYKQVCSNGLMISKCGGTMFLQKHIGIKPDEFYSGLMQSMKRVDELSAVAKEMITFAKSKSMHFDVHRMSESDFNTFVAQIKGSTKLSTEGATKVIDLMKTKYDDSRWGYINSITEIAQDYTLERRLELERIAGNLLSAA